MRIDILDWNYSPYTITTSDPKIAGAWFAEHAALLMSANAAIGGCRLQIWPQTPAEHAAVAQAGTGAGGGMRQMWLDQDSLLEFAGSILAAAAAIAGHESTPMKQAGGACQPAPPATLKEPGLNG